jgi:hypothetical protein
MRKYYFLSKAVKFRWFYFRSYFRIYWMCRLLENASI